MEAGRHNKLTKKTPQPRVVFLCWVLCVFNFHKKMSRTVEMWDAGSESGSGSESSESTDLDDLFEPANDVSLAQEGDNNSDGEDDVTSVDGVKKTVKKENEDSDESVVELSPPPPPSPTPSPRESLKRTAKSSPSVASSCGAEEEKRKMNETLSCSGCGLVSVPPIKSCPKGHLVCAICVDQTNDEGGGGGEGKCPAKECSEATSPPSGKLRKPSLMPCPFAETLLRKNATEPVACRNLEKLGCRVKLPLWEMTEHLKRCRQRTIKCFVTHPENCGGRLFSEEKFLEHLMTFHESKDLRFNTSTPDVPVFTHSFEASQAEMYGSGRETINVDHVRYKKGVFFLHGVREERSMYWWLTFLGPEEEAIKYQYSLKVWISTGNCKREISFTKMKIHSMEKHELALIRETGDVVGIDVASLETYRFPSDADKKNLNEFKFEITIEFDKSD